MSMHPNPFYREETDQDHDPPPPVGPDEPTTAAPFNVPVAPEPGRRKKVRMAAILLSAAVVLVALAVLAGVLILGSKPHSAEGWMKLGEKYLLELKYEEAIAAFLKVIELEPKNIPARLGLAEIYMLTGQYTEAETRLFEVLDIDDRQMEAYSQLQALYDLTDDWEGLGLLLQTMRQKGLEAYILFAQVNGTVAKMTADGSGINLPGVLVSLKHTGHKNQTDTTDGQGSFVFYVRGGSVELRFTKDGFTSVEDAREVRAGEQVELPLLLMMPDSDLPGLVSGRVMDQFTGLAVPGAVVIAVDDEGREAGQTEADEEGYYSLELMSGYYSLRSLAGHYSSQDLRIFAFTEHSLEDQDLLLSPHLGEGETWIELSWGDQPVDLDAHLVGPVEGGQQVQINWRTPNMDQGATWKATLSGDAQQANGLESIVLQDEANRIYSFYVHDYANLFKPNSATLGQSGAKVKILQSDGTVLEFAVPSGLTGDVWHVCDIQKGQVVAPQTPIHKIPYIPRNLSDGDYGDLWNSIKGSPLSVSKQLKSSEIEAMNVLGNRTVFDVVNEVGSPEEWMTKAEYLDHIKEWDEISTFGYGGEPYQFWAGSRFPAAEFRREGWIVRTVAYGKVLWGNFTGTNPNPFPFGVKLSMGLADTAKRLGLDYRATGLLQSRTMAEAKQFCQTHGVKTTSNYSFWIPSFYEYDDPIPYDDLLVALDKGAIVFREFDMSWGEADPSQRELHIFLVVQNKDYELLMELDHSKDNKPIQNISVSSRP